MTLTLAILLGYLVIAAAAFLFVWALCEAGKRADEEMALALHRRPTLWTGPAHEARALPRPTLRLVKPNKEPAA